MSESGESQKEETRVRKGKNRGESQKMRIVGKENKVKRRASLIEKVWKSPIRNYRKAGKRKKQRVENPEGRSARLDHVLDQDMIESVWSPWGVHLDREGRGLPSAGSNSGSSK